LISASARKLSKTERREQLLQAALRVLAVEPLAQGLVALAETDAVRFLQGDVRHHGGFTGCLNAVEHCNAREDVLYVPHNFGTLLGLVANAHLVSGAVEGDLLEYPVFEDDPHLDAEADPGMYPFELAFDLVEGTLDVHDGKLTVPDGPGLGIEVNEDVVDEYPFVEGAWTTFEYEDGG
jgi:L-alanine-DL-glutamate epimerase-like enolase superfamily enzyme